MIIKYIFIPQYMLWTLLWVAWNVFVSCLYLDLGGLSKVLVTNIQTHYQLA